MTNINDYAKFVDSTTSMESTNDSAFQVRVNQLGQLAPDIGWSRLMTSAIGMLAESGEFTEIMKKVLFQGREWNEENRFHMKRELGDVLWYWVQGCIALGYSPEEVMEDIMQFNDSVQKQRDILNAEKWASKVRLLQGQFRDTLREWVTTYNNGDVIVEQFKNNKLADKWTVKGDMTIEDCIYQMGREKANVK